MQDISASVGRGGRNLNKDTRIVQELLNRFKNLPGVPLVVDGRVGSKTISRIELFQRQVVGLRRPDGRVDPGRTTIRALNRTPGRGRVLLPPKVLNVPYLIQPTDVTCQSTCIKMYALYLLNQKGMGYGQTPNESIYAREASIMDIWKDINTGTQRPVQAKNAYLNMAWWLSQNFPEYRFELKSTNKPAEATNHVVKQINRGFPVMVSTNHAHSSGHIIMVIGYAREKMPEANMCSDTTYFVCHDPYGKFNPQLQSNLYGKRRFVDAQCYYTGGEEGPGKAVIYDIDGIRRIMPGPHTQWYFHMISPV